jgi:citrate lyase subunit beta/citryl-CoA lyase
VSYAEKLHDRASYRYNWQVLKRAKATGVAVPAAAEHAFFA